MKTISINEDTYDKIRELREKQYPGQTADQILEAVLSGAITWPYGCPMCNPQGSSHKDSSQAECIANKGPCWEDPKIEQDRNAWHKAYGGP